jgi:pimeloyl-ACP methyl ester carboxylesterase
MSTPKEQAPDAAKRGVTARNKGGASRQRNAERPPLELADQRRRLWTKLDPEFTFTPHFVKHAGHWIHFVDEGPPSAPVLFCVHGNPTWSFYWRKLIERFRDRYRVIAIDLLGMGLSEKPADYAYTLENRVGEVEFLVEELGLDELTLCLHDWGGAIGMGFARRHPEQVERLVLSNTAAWPGGKIPGRIALGRVPGLGTLAIRGLGMFSRMALRQAVHQKRGFSRVEKRGYLAPYGNFADRVAVEAFVKDIPDSPAHPSWAELAATGEALEQFADRPSCLLWGARDWCFTTDYCKGFKERWPAAEVHTFEQAGHYLLEDAPGPALDALDHFLAHSPSAKPVAGVTD